MNAPTPAQHVEGFLAAAGLLGATCLTHLRILRHLAAVPSATVSQTADAAGVSIASIRGLLDRWTPAPLHPIPVLETVDPEDRRRHLLTLHPSARALIAPYT